MLAERTEKFVRVHITRISTVDHGVFRFDKNLSFAVLFMNSDLDIYGRYGTRAGGAFKGPFRPLADTLHLANKDMNQKSFLKAAGRALELHAKWQDEASRAEIRKLLAPKRGATYLGRPVNVADAARTRRRSRNECFHCHRIAEEEVAHFFNNGKPVPDDLLWSFPMPDKIGFELDPNEMAKVRKITPGSDAAKAGMKVGDEIAAFAGHPVLSIADVQFALDQAPDSGTLPVEVLRAGQKLALELTLPKHWRHRDQFAWRYSFNGIKAKLLGLDEVFDLSAEGRREHGVKEDESGVQIGRVLRSRRRSGVNAEARKAGLRPKDIILSVDGKGRMTQSQMLAYVLQNKRPGDDVTFKVLRKGERKEFTYPVNRILKKRGHDH